MQQHKKVFLYLLFVLFFVPNMLCMELVDAVRPGVLSEVANHPVFLPKLDFASRLNFATTCKEYNACKDRDSFWVDLDQKEYINMLLKYARNDNAEIFAKLIRGEGAGNKVVRHNIQKHFGCASDVVDLQLLMPIFKTTYTDDQPYLCRINFEDLLDKKENAPLLYLLLKQKYNPACNDAFVCCVSAAVDNRNIDVLRVLRDDGRFIFKNVQRERYPYIKVFSTGVKKFQDTLIHKAVECDYQEMINIVIDLCEDPNVHNFDGLTPLHLAVARGFFDTVKSLCAHDKIDINCLNGGGDTPLYYASSDYYFSMPNGMNIFKFLCNHPKIQIGKISAHGRTMLHAIAHYGSLNDMKEFLLLKHVWTNLAPQDACGETPLHKAVRFNTSAMVEFLCGKYTSDMISTKDAEGWTALEMAHMMEHSGKIRIIVESISEKDATS